jgi:hypothetical protein
MSELPFQVFFYTFFKTKGICLKSLSKVSRIPPLYNAAAGW